MTPIHSITHDGITHPVGEVKKSGELRESSPKPEALVENNTTELMTEVILTLKAYALDLDDGNHKPEARRVIDLVLKLERK